jgi:hypothetical protein
MDGAASGLPEAPAGAPSPDWGTRLGHAGLLPFLAGAALVWLVHDELRPWVAQALALYGAVIVSFLGGIHWGVGLRERPQDVRLLAWGVTPSLLAWVAALMPPSAGLALLGMGLIVCYLVDRRLYPRHGLKDWLNLRFRLTAVASLCCFLGAAGT